MEENVELSDAAQALKNAILERNNFDDDEAGLALLDAGLRAHDLEIEALAIVTREGLTVRGDRGGTKAHPLLAVVRDQRAQFMAAMKMLGLLEANTEPKSVGRPTDFQLHLKGKR